MKKLLVYLFQIFILTACLTTEDAIDEIAIEEPVVVTEKEPETVIVAEAVPDPIEESIEPETYVATEEEYDKTFNEVSVLVTELNKIIASGDFITWKDHLSESYIEKYSDPELLKKLTENPFFKSQGIKLRKLRDYFKYAVMPARSNVVVDEIIFLTETEIKVFTLRNNEKYVIYTLVKQENQWIISE